MLGPQTTIYLGIQGVRNRRVGGSWIVDMDGLVNIGKFAASDSTQQL